MLDHPSDLKALIDALAHRGPPLRTLVVEDHFVFAQVMGMAIRTCGFEVEVLTESRLAVLRALEFRPHFILMDIELPGTDGYELIRQIRGNPPASRAVIVVISASENTMDRAKMDRLGIDYFLRKPFDLPSLLRIFIDNL